MKSVAAVLLRSALLSAAAVTAGLGVSRADDAPAPSSENTAPASAEETPARFESLKTTKGKEYRDCVLVRAEPDALVIRHAGGMARVSFFELPKEIQDRFGFDPFEAIEAMNQLNRRNRETRWRMFWERQKHEAEQAELADARSLVATAESEWVPVEASVIQVFADGSFLASCQRVVFEPTKTKSKLGFEIDGPPRRKLVKFGSGRLVLRPELSAEKPSLAKTWKGYLCPWPEGKRDVSYRGTRTEFPSHRAVPANATP
ncbi:MAG: hypothetical protein H7A53_03980 [Akkermansiaceae bacterium]|nr:hypothetical protein [Akkermansiaceae bacterium]MCP5550032.1 hypothetical protein [Akkermansiaceae bacterium]